MSAYEPCVLGSDGRCTRWGHDHSTASDPRPAEGPDREALLRALDEVECPHVSLSWSCRACAADAVLALLPTPPAPGDDQPCAECGVEEFRHGTVDGCSGFRPLPTPQTATTGQGASSEASRGAAAAPASAAPSSLPTPPAPGDGEELRAEREHFVRAAAVNVGQDIMAADVRFLFDRLDEARAALAARDTDQGAGEALAEVERLVAKPWALRDQRGQTVMAVPIHDLRAALARATPEARIHNPGVHKPFTDDGATYCGHAGDGGIWDGCGEAWPCSTVRARATPEAGEEKS
jgi:hypothetical protein